MINPFLTKFNTPFETPDFNKIKPEHFIPAFKEGIVLQQKEIEKIISNQEPPDFYNSVESLERSGELLRKVSNVFYNLNASNTNDQLQAIAKEIAPILSEHRDNINMNDRLFQRIKVVYELKDNLELTREQQELLEKRYKDFVRGGANLDESAKTRLQEINKELSLLSVQFGENVLAETNAFKLIIEDTADLAGLPMSIRDAAFETGKEPGEKGKWVFTLQKPSMISFLQYAESRPLREKIYMAYINRGNHDNQNDNREIVKRTVNLRLERARLLGYPDHAAYVLEKNMAKDPQHVYQLLDQLWEPSLDAARQEADELQMLIQQESGDFKLQPWDWWYYSEKLRKAKYYLDEEELRSYFVLENVIQDGIFGVAHKLYGLKFVERYDIPKYQEDVRVFDVQEEDGEHLAVLFMDFYPRASKDAGAWMDAFRKQAKIGDSIVSPIITVVCNFMKPSGDNPSLLTFEEVSTLFHEFGHSLHGMLSNCTYTSLSGTAVPRDFVELPSQIMENWAAEPDVMKMFARHYQTGEVIPQELIDKIINSKHFNQGFEMTEYLAASYLDMDWHTIQKPVVDDVMDFEQHSLDKTGLMPEIIVRYRSPYFSHIFSGGYSAGYYSYMWAEVLDADAFEAFKEKGLFDHATAQSFRKNILERGGTEDPMSLYIRFRGAEPNRDALLRRKGLLL